MLNEQEIIDRLFGWGHFNNPAFPDTLNVNETDLPGLKLADSVVRQAIASFQDFMVEQLEPLSLKHHMRPAVFDGEIGPATSDLLAIERCGCPDYSREPRPAIGTGNWQACRGVGNFHAAVVRITNPESAPAHLRPVFEAVKQRVSAAYAELGLRLVWDDNEPRPEIEATFVGRSAGWIGLALLGHGRGCGDTIWCRYLASYRGRNVLTEWTTLFKHEIGHNCGLEHSRGGVMNPSIVSGLPVSWKGDPHEPTLRRLFGGEPVDTPDPGPPPRPRVSLEEIVVVIPENTPAGSYRFVTRPFDGV